MAGAAVIVESEVVSPRLKRDDNARIAKKNSIAHVYTSTNGGIAKKNLTENSVPSEKRNAPTAKIIFTKNHLHAILEPTSPIRRLFKISTMFKRCLCVQSEEERGRCLEAVWKPPSLVWKPSGSQKPLRKYFKILCTRP